MISNNEEIISVKKDSRDMLDGSCLCDDRLGNGFDRKVKEKRTDWITLFDASSNVDWLCKMAIDDARSCAACQHFEDDIAETRGKVKMTEDKENSTVRNRIIGFAKVNEVKRNLRETCLYNMGRDDVVMDDSFWDEASLKRRDDVGGNTICSGGEDLGENFEIRIEKCDRTSILKVTREAFVFVDKNSNTRFEIGWDWEI